MSSVPAAFVVCDVVLAVLSPPRFLVGFLFSKSREVQPGSLSLMVEFILQDVEERLYKCHLKALSFVACLDCVFVFFSPVPGEMFRSRLGHLSSWLLCFMLSVVSWHLKPALSLCDRNLI